MLRVPFYYPLKLSFLLWCFLPQSKGAQTVYERLVRPALRTHQHQIDRSIQTVRSAAGTAVSEVGAGVQRSLRAKSIMLQEVRLTDHFQVYEPLLILPCFRRSKPSSKRSCPKRRVATQRHRWTLHSPQTARSRPQPMRQLQLRPPHPQQLHQIQTACK